MKKQSWIIFAAIFVLGLFMFTTAEVKAEGIEDRIKLSGLIEFGGVWQDIDYRGGVAAPAKENDSDFCLTTVELTAEAEVNEWVNAAITLLYEDATFGDDGDGDFNVDEATVTIGNTEEFPLYLSAGKMFVPFGALLTHFPDDPLVHAPLTLLMGETSEKALLLGVEYEGFSVCGYVFNGDMDETGEDQTVESYGFDANYLVQDLDGVDILIGASYISNIADSDGLTDGVGQRTTYSGALVDGVWDANAIQRIEKADDINDYVDGFDAYLHLGYADFFFDAEYMTALDEFEGNELATGGPTGAAGAEGAEPEVWNFEVGYNYNWGKNLEIVLKYAGSDEADQLGYPEERYGICLNQELFDSVIVSLAYLNDDFEDNDVDNRDDRDVVFAQIAIEF